MNNKNNNNSPLKGFKTRSDLLKIAFSTSDDQKHPDIVEFFDLFGFKVFVGTISIDDKFYKPPTLNLMFEDFNRFLDNADEDQSWDPKNVPREIHSTYFTKIIYNDFLAGNSWHTPISAIYDHDHDHFILTKGYKKIMASRLIGINTLSAVVISYSRQVSNRNLKRIKTDRQFYDFLYSISADKIDVPTIGIDYREIDGIGHIPTIHWINISYEIGKRLDYHPNFLRDLKQWQKFPGRIVTSDILPSHLLDYYDHKLLSGVMPNSDIIKQHMHKNSVAHVHSSRDRHICCQLIRALAWLNTDAQGNLVGEAVSSCGRYKIVYNNRSNLVLEIPPGILNK